MIGRRFEIKQTPPETAADHTSHWLGVAALLITYFCGARDWKLVVIPFSVMLVMWISLIMDIDDE